MYVPHKGDIIKRLLRLTQSERQVLWFVCEGMSYESVSSHIGIKENTVKSYMHNIYVKLGFMKEGIDDGLSVNLDPAYRIKLLHEVYGPALRGDLPDPPKRGELIVFRPDIMAMVEEDDPAKIAFFRESSDQVNVVTVDNAVEEDLDKIVISENAVALHEPVTEITKQNKVAVTTHPSTGRTIIWLVILFIVAGTISVLIAPSIMSGFGQSPETTPTQYISTPELPPGTIPSRDYTVSYNGTKLGLSDNLNDGDFETWASLRGGNTEWIFELPEMTTVVGVQLYPYSDDGYTISLISILVGDEIGTGTWNTAYGCTLNCSLPDSSTEATTIIFDEPATVRLVRLWSGPAPSRLSFSEVIILIATAPQ